uniref:Cathepsin L n=1 Tax=Suberites domuncula TaxID=55567 RepID=Q6A1I0_SUBDO|nr:cathepsin L [Suberites domuncula]
MKVLIILSLVALSVAAFDFPEEWVAWKQEHSKEYTEELEELRRHTIWQSNKKFIDSHNSVSDKFGYTLEMNEFGDLSGVEFKQIYNGYIMQERANDTKLFTASPYMEPAASVDWRQKGVVSEVKNQGQCGSCWSFSATGSLEGQHALKMGRLVSLSEQNLMDCSSRFGNHGCKGGIMDDAFRYVISNHGVDTESSYPYTAKDGYCRFNQNNVGATETSYRDIARGSESSLTQASAQIGPISVAIDASHRSFQFYKNGVYYEPSCSSSRLDHGVLVVGYGTEGGQDYFIVKNSWGTRWGMDGYIMMSRNRRNNCGIASQASYPIV